MIVELQERIRLRMRAAALEPVSEGVVYEHELDLADGYSSP